jgi:choloylglycine hydrolase
MKKTTKLTTLILTSIVIVIPASACTEFSHDFKNVGVFTARTMDSFIDLKPNLAVYPRGIETNGRLTENPLKWTSKYGYTTIDETNLGNATAEGFNEKGLSAHLLYLSKADEPARNVSKPGVNGLTWVRYVLGNFSTVQEVVDDLKNYQIFIPEVKVDGVSMILPIHFAVEDSTGDSALIEYIDKKLVIHRNYTVLANEPSYTEQMENLAKIKNTNKYSIDNLPGGANSANRFVRAAFINENLPIAKTSADAVNYLFAANDSVSVPFTKDYQNEKLSDPDLIDKWPTQWKSVSDITNKKLYVTDTLVGNRIYVDLNKVDLSAGQPIKTVSIMDDTLVGDVTSKLK